jgi:hypothetical protein
MILFLTDPRVWMISGDMGRIPFIDARRKGE